MTAGIAPDLRHSQALSRDVFRAIALDGALKDAGMAGFAGTLSPDEVEDIRGYLGQRARQALAAGS